MLCKIDINPDSKVHGAYMVPIWGRQDPGGPHVGPMNFAIWEATIGSRNNSVPYKRQAISWTNNNQVHWRMYGSCGFIGLMQGKYQYIAGTCSKAIRQNGCYD